MQFYCNLGEGKKRKKYKVVVENEDVLYNTEQGKRLLEYSMQLVMLKNLLERNLITEKEYKLVKSKLQ